MIYKALIKHNLQLTQFTSVLCIKLSFIRSSNASNILYEAFTQTKTNKRIANSEYTSVTIRLFFSIQI